MQIIPPVFLVFLPKSKNSLQLALLEHHPIYPLLSWWQSRHRIHIKHQVKLYNLFLFLWCNSPMRTGTTSFLRFLDHTKWHTTVGRTPLDEGSARRLDLYWQHNIHDRQAFMSTAGYFFFILNFSLIGIFFCFGYFICTSLSWLCLLSLLYDTHNTNIHAPGDISFL
jgi:hypothetical protein